MNIDQMVNDFLDWKCRLTPVSVRRYRNALKQWYMYLDIHHEDKFNPAIRFAIKWGEYLRESGNKTNTINLYLSVLRQYYAYLNYQNEKITNIFKSVKNENKRDYTSKSALNITQVAALLESIATDTIIGLRDYAMIILMVATGLRRIEINRIDIDDVCHTNPAIMIMRKGAKDKVRFPIDTNLYETITRYLAVRLPLVGEDRALFVSHAYHNRHNRLSTKCISDIINGYYDKAGLNTKDYTPHSLRHTAAVLSHEYGATMLDIMNMLGHTSLTTTSIYLNSIHKNKITPNEAIVANVKLIKDALKKKSETNPDETERDCI